MHFVADPRPTPVFDTYWRFAAERQAVFFRRCAREPGPWTDDEVLRQFKFTNAYRAADRASQYLIRNVIACGDQSAAEVVFRILVFKTFNRVETWERLRESLGEVRYSGYSYRQYDEVLTRHQGRGAQIYSGAYIMPSGQSSFGFREKHRNHLKLIEVMMADKVHERVGEAKSMRAAYEILRSYPGIGPFLAFQYVTDINYSNVTNFSEMAFVVPGPGARSGIQKCFSDLGGMSEASVITWVAERQADEFASRGLAFRSLWGRPLQLVDCQNLFCEVDKYARVAHPKVKGLLGRTRIKRRFTPNLEGIKYWFPPKWGINDAVTRERDTRERAKEPAKMALVPSIFDDKDITVGATVGVIP